MFYDVVHFDFISTFNNKLQPVFFQQPLSAFLIRGNCLHVIPSRTHSSLNCGFQSSSLQNSKQCFWSSLNIRTKQQKLLMHTITITMLQFQINEQLFESPPFINRVYMLKSFLTHINWKDHCSKDYKHLQFIY